MVPHFLGLRRAEKAHKKYMHPRVSAGQNQVLGVSVPYLLRATSFANKHGEEAGMQQSSRDAQVLDTRTRTQSNKTWTQ